MLDIGVYATHNDNARQSATPKRPLGRPHTMKDNPTRIRAAQVSNTRSASFPVPFFVIFVTGVAMVAIFAMAFGEGMFAL